MSRVMIPLPDDKSEDIFYVSNKRLHHFSHDILVHKKHHINLTIIILMYICDQLEILQPFFTDQLYICYNIVSKEYNLIAI